MVKPVRIELRGGLGNQLFQYYAGAFLAQKHEAGLEVDFTHLVSNHENHVVNSVKDGRDFLSILNLPGKKIVQTRGNFYMEKAIRKALKRTNYFETHLLAPKMFVSSYEPQSVGYDPQFGERPYRRVGGYFQTHKYFDLVVEANFDYFPKLQNTSAWFNETLGKVQDPTAVVVHLREHYPWLSGTFVQCGMEYYTKALGFLEKELGPLKLIIFGTPDIDIKSYIPSRALENHEFLSKPENSPDVESLVLMSKARAIVTANSTFSWWAGRLATEKQLIIAPKNIYVNKPNPIDYYPQDWKTL